MSKPSAPAPLAGPSLLASARLVLAALLRPLRHLRFMSIYFAVPLILVIWLAVFGHITNERMAARRAVIEDAAALTRVLEENVIRTVGEVDRALKFLRASFERDHAGLSTWSKRLSDAALVSDLMLQTAVIDAKGQLLATSLTANLPPPTAPANLNVSLADRPHFKIHADRPDQDQLYLSAPVLGRASGKWSVQVTRRFSIPADHRDASAGQDQRPGTQFGGVLVASLDPKQLSRLYDAIDVGPDGAVAWSQCTSYGR
jgi:hypothetical protein